ILLWCPIAILLYLQRLSKLSIYIKLVVLGCALELFQLFVYSRVTDITDVILAFFAGWLSYKVMTQLQHFNFFQFSQVSQKIQSPHISSQTSPQGSIIHHMHYLWLGLMIASYSIIILLVFWYPYNFNF